MVLQITCSGVELPEQILYQLSHQGSPKCCLLAETDFSEPYFPDLLEYSLPQKAVVRIWYGNSCKVSRAVPGPMNAGCDYQEDDGTRRDRQVGTGGRMSRSLIRREKREGGRVGWRQVNLREMRNFCGTKVYLWDVGLKIG